MISVDYCRLMARYNHWMNTRLYVAAGELDDAERKRDRGAFFGSLHRTLNHLVWGDRTWLGRFTGDPYGVPGWGADMFDDFTTLSRERDIADNLIVDYCSGLDVATLASTLEYRTTRGDARRVALWMALAHFFNHETHHRGQALTILKQAGKDIGVTDLAQMPGVTQPEFGSETNIR